MVGLCEDNKVTTLLGRVGKIITPVPNESFYGAICKAGFFGHDSFMSDEGTYRESFGGEEISYHAYSITYAQYLEFIKKLESLQTENNKFHLYKPIDEEAGWVLLENTSDLMGPMRSPPEDLTSSVKELSLNNTCRHTAIKVVEEVRDIPVSTLVSSHFFRSLPYTTCLDYGVPSSEIPFYVLPQPPTSLAEISVEKLKVAQQIYQQMENMLLIEPNSQSTRNKFNCLRQFYLNLIGPQREQSLDDLLMSIRQWKHANASTLNVLRETFFFDSFFTRESKTTQLINKIEEDLRTVASAVTA